MRVAIDKPRRYDLAGRIDFFFSAFRNASDRRDTITDHADIRPISWQSCAIDYRAVSYHEIVHVVSSHIEAIAAGPHASIRVAQLPSKTVLD
jgi:hypothetical protein